MQRSFLYWLHVEPTSGQDISLSFCMGKSNSSKSLCKVDRTRNNVLHRRPRLTHSLGKILVTIICTILYTTRPYGWRVVVGGGVIYHHPSTNYYSSCGRVVYKIVQKVVSSEPLISWNALQMHIESPSNITSLRAS